MKPSTMVWGSCSLFFGLLSCGLGSVAAAAPNQSITLMVTGPAVNSGKVQRCEDVARRHGFILAPQAPVQVTLELNRGYNRLVVTSQRRGPIVDTPRPGWGMEQLCEDAMQNAERAFMDGPGGAPPPPQYYPPAAPYYPPAYAPPPPGGSMQMALDVTGSESNPGKQERCMRVAQRRGIVLNPSAPFRVTLILQHGLNHLQITSGRGELYNQPKPGWGMEQLCEDAISTAQGLYGSPGSAPPPAYNNNQNNAPPPPPPQKRPGYALGPIPPAKELAPNVKSLADGGVKAWQGAQFEVSLTAFREAHKLSGNPQFLFDQAVCEQRLSRFSEALSHTQQFLDKAPQSAYRPYAEQLFSELQGAMGNE